MRVATVQFHPRFGKINENMEKASAMMEKAGADLYILPELCFTGYAFTSRQEVLALAESVSNGFTLNRMRELSSRLNSGIIFGFPEKSGERLYNSCAFVSPETDLYVYRKLHLYYYEKEWFLPGDNPLGVFEFRECRIGLMICFDWIFPEVARTLALSGAHLICHPANLVMSYCQNAMITRCIENAVYAATSNRIGRERRGEFDFEFTGKSQLISPRGEILYRSSEDKEELGVADINPIENTGKAINPKNDLFGDRRPEFYGMVADAEEAS